MLKKGGLIAILLVLPIFLLSVVSAGVVINSPNSLSDTLNTLSTILNVTIYEGFNSTINYSWNGGIKTYTLCRNCTATNYTSITLPRQNSYTLTVWAFNSSGYVQSNTSLFFVGNNSITNDTVDIIAYDADSSFKEAESQIKFDMTNYLNKNVYQSKLFLNISNVRVVPGSSQSYMGYYAYAISNQTWNESIQPSEYDSMPKSSFTQGFFLPDRGTVNTTESVWASIDVTNITKNSNNQNNLTIRFSSNDSAHVTHYSTPTSQIDDFEDAYPVSLATGEYLGTSVYYYYFFAKENNVSIPYLNISYYSQNTAPIITNILANSSNFSVTTFNATFNITDDNDYLINISLFIDDIRNSAVFNQPINVSINNSFNFSILGISEGLHTWYIQTYDSDGVQSNSSTYTFRIDTTAPSITITHPTNGQEFSYNTSIDLNFTVIDSGVGVNTCWYNLDNGANKTLPSCLNDSFNASVGSHILYFFANDTLNNIIRIDVPFSISLDAPSISLSFPLNGIYLNYKNNVYLNYTTSDSNGVSTCQIYHNFNGSFSLNLTQTYDGVVTSASNFSVYNLTDNSYLWNVWCNDSTNSYRFSSFNKTFTIDTIYPVIGSVIPTTTSGNQVFSFTYSVNDLNLDTSSCKYSLDNGLTNHTIPLCTSPVTASVPSFDTSYTLTVYAKDLANNENSAQTNIFISSSLPLFIGGGGGGAEASSTAICMRTNLSISDLDKCKVYARLRNYCTNYSISKSTCILTDSIKNDLVLTLKSQGADLNTSQLNELIENYNNQDIQELIVLNSDITKYNLFSAKLEILAPKFSVSPSRLDTFYIILSEDSVFEYIVTAGKSLKSVKVIEGDLGLKAEIISDSSVKVTYELSKFPPEFTSKTIVGKIEYVSVDNEPVFQEVALRAIYLSKSLMIYIGIGAVGIICIVLLIKYTKFGRR